MLAEGMALNSPMRNQYVSAGPTAQQSKRSQKGTQAATMDMDKMICQVKSARSRGRAKKSRALYRYAVSILGVLEETCEGRHNVPHETVGFAHRFPRDDPNDVGKSCRCPQLQQVDLYSGAVVSL